MSGVETEFLLISGAIAHLEAGMFGGYLTRPEPVRKLKKKQPRLSVGFGAQKERAAAVILAAILRGNLSVHVLPQSPANGGCRSIVVPLEVLKLMPKARGGLPDHPVSHPVSFLRNHPVAPDLFAALSVSALYLEATEFVAWYEKKKSHRRWPSQRTSKERPKKLKQPSGRPTKQTNELHFNQDPCGPREMVGVRWHRQAGKIASFKRCTASQHSSPRGRPTLH